MTELCRLPPTPWCWTHQQRRTPLKRFRRNATSRLERAARRRGSRATTRSHRKWCTTTRWTTATRPPSRRPARRAAARCARRETSSAWVRAFVLSFFRGRSRAITRPPNAHDTRTRARARDAQANIGRHDSLASEMVHDDGMDHGSTPQAPPSAPRPSSGKVRCFPIAPRALHSHLHILRNPSKWIVIFSLSTFSISFAL